MKTQGRSKVMDFTEEMPSRVALPIIDVQFSDEKKQKIREDALRIARAMGASDEEWERYRARAEQPFWRDLGMLIDPVRKIELMRKDNDQ